VSARGGPARPWGVALCAVLALLLTATVLSVVQTHRRDQRAAAARAATTAAAARQQQLVVASRDRAIDAAHRTYLELTVLRSALGSVPDPATQAPAQRREAQAFWTAARGQSAQRLTGVAQAYEADLATPHPRWPALDQAMRDGLDQVAVTQDYLGNLFARTPGSPAWRDRAAMQEAVAARVRTLAEAMGEVCVTSPTLDSEHVDECADIVRDLPKPGAPDAA
jgi:hypothetical protein